MQRELGLGAGKREVLSTRSPRLLPGEGIGAQVAQHLGDVGSRQGLERPGVEFTDGIGRYELEKLIDDARRRRSY